MHLGTYVIKDHLDSATSTKPKEKKTLISVDQPAPYMEQYTKPHHRAKWHTCIVIRSKSGQFGCRRFKWSNRGRVLWTDSDCASACACVFCNSQSQRLLTSVAVFPLQPASSHLASLPADVCHCYWVSAGPAACAEPLSDLCLCCFNWKNRQCKWTQLRCNIGEYREEK